MKGMVDSMSKKCRAFNFMIGICMCIQLFFGGISAFAEDAEFSAESVEVINKLNAFGVTDINLERISPDTMVTRGEFSYALASILYKNFRENRRNSADTAVEYLSGLGIMSGYAPNEYGAEQNIKVSEAAKMLVCAMGYASVAESKGGYPNGYMNLAIDIGILDNIPLGLDDEIDTVNCAVMIDNALEEEILVSNGSNLTYKSEIPMREYFLDIKDDRGIVEACGETAIYERTASGDDIVVINETEYYTGLDMSELVGMSIKYYYRDNGLDGEGELLYYTTKNNKVVTLYNKDIVDFSNGTYKYEKEHGRIHTINIYSNISYIYNGRYAESIENFIPKNGSVTFIDNNSDGRYDVLRITDKRIVIVAGVSEEDLIIKDKYSISDNISLVDVTGEKYEIFDGSGTAIDIKSILPGSVFEAEVSADGESVKLFLDDKTIIGTVDSVSSEEIHISGREYRLSYRFMDLLASGEFEKSDIIGGTHVFYLTQQGEIAYMDQPLNTEYRLGVVMGFYRNDTDNETPFIKIFDEGGTVEKFQFAEKGNFNGIKYKNHAVDSSMVEKFNVVKYKLDIQGRVTEIYFPSEESDELKTVCSGSMFYKTSASGGFFGRVESGKVIGCNVAADAKLFILPGGYLEDWCNEDYYSVVTGANLRSWDTYKIIGGYNSSGEVGRMNTALIISNDRYNYIPSTRRTPILINSFYQSWSEDEGEERTVIKGIAGGKEREFEIVDRRSDKSSLPFEEGDMILAVVNSSGQITLTDSAGLYDILFEYNDGDIKVSNSGYGYSRLKMDSDGTIRFGDVYDTENNAIFINVRQDMSENQGIERLNTTSTSAHVYVYDQSMNKYRVGDLSEAVGYKLDSSNFSRAYAYVDYNYAEIVIFK